MAPKLLVEQLPVGQMNANCYLLYYKQSGECVIIDPGDEAEYIERKIADHELTPTQIIATHGHFDHILAATELKLAYKIPFLLHEKDDFLLARMRDSSMHFQGIDPGPPPPVDIFLKGGEEISMGKTKFQILPTPGHTPGSICLYLKAQKTIFVGDLCFADGSIGRTDHRYSNQKDMINSLQKLHKLPKGTLVYPGHGEEFYL